MSKYLSRRTTGALRLCRLGYKRLFSSLRWDFRCRAESRPLVRFRACIFRLIPALVIAQIGGMRAVGITLDQAKVCRMFAILPAFPVHSILPTA